jgi:CheY-like chemotaxis protein
MEQKQKSILYVDDDADDRELFLEIIKDTNPEAEVVLAENGWEAVNYLQRALATQLKLPCLIVLDINMPLWDGKETFNQIKKEGMLQNVPIIIFTSSENPADKAFFNDLGIAFITKPSSCTFMYDIANHMLNYCDGINPEEQE